MLFAEYSTDFETAHVARSPIPDSFLIVDAPAMAAVKAPRFDESHRRFDNFFHLSSALLSSNSPLESVGAR